jgi:ribonuclease HI
MTISEDMTNDFISKTTGTVIFTDGASNSTHFLSGIGVVVFCNHVLTHHIALKLPLIGDRIQTNNESEYKAMIFALEYIAENGLSGVTIYADSKLVVNQVNGEWAIKKPHLFPLYTAAVNLLNSVQNVKIKHVRREYNYFADYYSKYAIGQITQRKIDKFNIKYRNI